MTPTIFAPCLFAIGSMLAANDPPDSATPIVREVIYKNAHHIPKKELAELSGIRPGDPLDLDANQAACLRIQEFLKKKGRFWATVSLAKGNVRSDTQVIFIVTEGPVVRVRSTKFVGNETQTTRCLQNLIGDSRAFIAASFTDHVTVLEDYYRGLGYRDVKVSREMKFGDDQSYVDVVYTIAEGLRYRVKDWVIKGNTKELAATPIIHEHFKRGEFYSEEIEKSRLRDVTDYFGWRGYRVEVTKKVFEIPGERGMLRVQYEVTESAPNRRFTR